MEVSPTSGEGQACQVPRIRQALRQDPGDFSQIFSGGSWLILAYSFLSCFSPRDLWAGCSFKKGSHTLWGPASPAGCLAGPQLGPSWAGFECWTLWRKGTALNQVHISQESMPEEGLPVISPHSGPCLPPPSPGSGTYKNHS